MSRNDVTRRDWLKWASLSGAALATASTVSTASRVLGQSTRPTAARQRVLRFAHITDVHVQPELDANQGFIACLQHIAKQPDKVDAIFNTGDCIFDSMHAQDARVGDLWDMFTGIVRSHVSIPIEHTIGNHDVWGLDKTKSKTTGEERNWGKARAMEALGLKRPYRSFDRAGWHVIVLDSVMPWKDSYKGHLDARQFDWLAKDLARTDPKTPVLVLSHIPILSTTVFTANDVAATGDYQIPGGAMHLDWMPIRDLFKQHPNVRLCLSGHVHLLDRVDYNGVTYLCNGAVSGGWWKETNMGDCDAGYALIDLYDDGSFEHTYVTYGWTYRTRQASARG
ncbi:MAG: metallophosphoesterase family protein [Tepidisphaeraceae bacterium]